MLEKINTSSQTATTKARLFAVKIALFNSLGFFLLLTAITYVDARLTTHVVFHRARIYPWGHTVAIVGGLSIFLGTFLSLARASSWKYQTVLPTIILWVVGAASLPFFLPEFPHAALTYWTIYLSIASLFSCGIHYWKHSADSQDLSERERIQEARQYTTLWRNVTVGLLLGYIAILVPSIIFLWTAIPSTYVTDPAEKVLLSQFQSWVITSFSLYVLFGVLYEALKKFMEATDLSRSVKRQQGRVREAPTAEGTVKDSKKPGAKKRR
jgi:hypothetical protein